MIDKFMHGFLNRVYDLEDYTQLEINSKLIQKIDEVIEECNNVFEFVDWLKEQGLTDEVINTLLAWKEDGTLDEIINENIFSKLETDLNKNINNIAITMPPPSTVDENTKNLQDILDIAKDKNVNLTVQFQGGHYELYTCIIYDNTTIKMTNNTVLKNNLIRYDNPYTSESVNVNILFMNAKPLDEEDSKIYGYNGRSNIIIDGGIIDCISAFCLCHGQNITIKNVTFRNCSSSHYIQIGACKNVKIQNCKFIGTTEKSNDRNYVEFIQIDWMISAGQPYWSSESNIYDSTENDGIEIDGCEFIRGVGDYNFMYTCIGSHSNDNEVRNKNIIIKNCKFTGYSFRALTINRMENVIIENNIFKDTENSQAINLSYSNNVTITSTNKIKGGNRALSSTNSSNIKIDGLLIEEVNGVSDFILIGECNNVELNKVRFVNCETDGYNVLIRNSTNIIGYNCQDINTIADGGYFYRAYIKDDGINERITIKDTITDKKEILVNSANSIINSDEEIIWRGEAYNGEISLPYSLDKFKNLKIYIYFYGDVVKDLKFVNETQTIREFNLANDINDLTSVRFVEINLTLDSNKIIINSNNQLDVSNGDHTPVSTTAKIYRITGERIYY